MPARRGDRQPLDGAAVIGAGFHGCARGKPEVRLVGPDPDHDLAADPVRTADPADDYPHRGQRTSLASSRSIRTYRPAARAPITVRSALAVRPPLPMTLPRSSG